MRRRVFWFTLLLLTLMFCLPSVVLAQEGDTGAVSGGEVALLLAPLVAAAAVIERVLEMLFSWYESVILNAGSFLGLGGKYVRWAQQQLDIYRSELLSLRTARPTTTTEIETLRRAEENLANAEERLIEWLKSPLYTSRKRVISLFGGIVLGVILAFATRLQMLSLLGIRLGATGALGNLAAGMDMLLTGLVIGTGSAPVHSLIGLLQNTKEAVDSARALWSGKAIREITGVLQAVQREEVYRDLRREGVVPGPERTPEGVLTPGAAPAPLPEPAVTPGLSEVEVGRVARRLLR